MDRRERCNVAALWRESFIPKIAYGFNCRLHILFVLNRTPQPPQGEAAEGQGLRFEPFAMADLSIVAVLRAVPLLAVWPGEPCVITIAREVVPSAFDTSGEAQS